MFLEFEDGLQGEVPSTSDLLRDVCGRLFYVCPEFSFRQQSEISCRLLQSILPTIGSCF